MGNIKFLLFLLLASPCSASLIAMDQTPERCIFYFADKTEYTITKEDILAILIRVGPGVGLKQAARVLLKQEAESKVDIRNINPDTVFFDFDILTGEIKDVIVFLEAESRIAEETKRDTGVGIEEIIP